MDLETLIGLIEADAELEGAAAYFAAQRINPSQRKELEKALLDCESYATEHDTGGHAFFRLNLRFHRAFLPLAAVRSCGG